MKKQEFPCKESGCKEKVRCTSSPAMIVAKLAGSSTVSAQLTCRNGHTNEYQVRPVELPFGKDFWSEQAKDMVKNSAANIAASADNSKASSRGCGQYTRPALLAPE